MAGEIIQAKYDDLENVASRFDQEFNEIEQMIQKLNRSLQQLTDGGWLGEAAERFFAEMELDVLPGVHRLHEALGEGGRTTKDIIQTLQGAEETAGAIFKNDGSTTAQQGFTPSNMTQSQFASLLGNNGFGNPGSLGTGGGAIGNDYGIPRDWLSGVDGSLNTHMANNSNDYGIPRDWLSGVSGPLGGNDYGIPRDWLSDVRDGVSEPSNAGRGDSSGGGSSGGGSGGGEGSGGGGGSDAGSPEANQPTAGSGNSSPQQANTPQPYQRSPAAQNTFAAQGPIESNDGGGQSRQSYRPQGASSGTSTPQPTGATHSSTSSGTASGSADGGNGFSLGLAAASPFLALAGKMIKDKIEKK